MSRVDDLQRLRILFTSSEVQSLIIVVPDIGLSEPEQWHKAGEAPWIEKLHDTKVPKSQIMLFDYDYNSKTFSWKDLISMADVLLDDILSLWKDRKINQCPLHFIALGVGGIIVKKAIQYAYYFQQNYFLFVLSGIVLIGTPHSASRDLNAWEGVSILPKVMLKGFKEKHSLDQNEVLQLSSICEKFDELNLEIPIFSAYELQKTTYKSVFGKSAAMIVGRDFCSVQTNSEELVGVASDYETLHCLDNVSWSRLTNFIHNAISKAQMRMIIELDRRNATIPADRTIRSHSSIPETWSSRKNKETDQGSISANALNFGTTLGPIPDSTSQRRKLKLPCHMIKHRFDNPNFFGRWEILRRLEETLLPSTNSTGLKVFSLCGVGGVGKTEIAARFLHTYKRAFDAVFWIEANRKANFSQSFSKISQALNLEKMHDVGDQVVSTNLVKQWLQNPFKEFDVETRGNDISEEDEAKWLLIFDNVESMDDLVDFWPTFAQRGAVLITSRIPLSTVDSFFESLGVDLLPFDQNDAAKFLLKLTRRDYDRNSPIPDAVLAIVERFGGLPLALEQMANIIQRKGIDFSEFLRKYDLEENLRELAAGTGRRIGPQSWKYAHNLASVWALDDLDDKASALFDCISLLDPDGIKEIMFENGLPGCLDGNFPDTEDQYQGAILELTSRSVVTRDLQLGELRVLRIIQDITRSQMSSKRLCEVFEATVRLLFRAWPFAALANKHKTGRWPLCQSLIPHISKVCDLYRSYGVPNSLFPAQSKFAELIVDAAWYLHERGGGKRFFEFLDLAQSICGNDPEHTLNIMSDIYYTRGAEAAETNQKKTASENNRKFLDTRLKISETSPEGRKDPKLAQAYNQAGNAYLDAYDFENALYHYQQALTVFSSLNNYNETMTTICVANLGFAYWLQGKLDEAENLTQTNLRAWEREYRIDDTESFRKGRLLHVLGNVFASRGRFVDAFNHHARALLQYQLTLGNEHHRTADMCYKVAEDHLPLREYASALSMLERASRVWESRDHYGPEVARMNFLWSKIALALGDEDEAASRKKIALEKYRTCVPHDTRPDDELSEDDFDRVLGFQSR